MLFAPQAVAGANQDRDQSRLQFESAATEAKLGHSLFLEMLVARDQLVHLESTATAPVIGEPQWTTKQLATVGQPLLAIAKLAPGMEEFDTVLGFGITANAAIAAAAALDGDRAKEVLRRW